MAGQKFKSVRRSLAQLWSLIEPRERRALSILTALTLIGAFADALTIGIVMPFLALLAAEPGSGEHVRWLKPLFDFVGANSLAAQLVAATALLCLGALASAVLRILLTRKTRDFTSAFGHRLSVELQRRMLSQSYAWHARHNSSEQLAAIEKAELVNIAVVLPLVQAVASAILGVLVLAVLVWIAPMPTVLALVALAAIYYVLGVTARKRLRTYANRIDDAFDRRIRIVQEGLGGIRDIILDGSQERVVDQFRAADAQLAEARADAAFVSSVPRFIVEALTVITIALLALALARREGGLVASLPVLGALALGAQRLLPVMQQLYSGWTSAATNGEVVDDVIRRLSLPLTETSAAAPMVFEKSVEFRAVSYAYRDRAHAAVDSLNFSIRRGSRVALLGPTGSGKTTTADLLMGLLLPTAGEIFVDGSALSDGNRQSWRANVAHVPQMLFLADATVAENIAMTRTLEEDRVREAVAMAQLEEFVAGLPHGLETRVGEGGVQISGGQRQRLAIARAIYKNTPLLIFDEATSALDPATEAAVLSAIEALQRKGRTIVIIAHRASTTAGCDQVLRLEDGRLVGDGCERGYVATR